MAIDQWQVSSAVTMVKTKQLLAAVLKFEPYGENPPITTFFFLLSSLNTLPIITFILLDLISLQFLAIMSCGTASVLSFFYFFYFVILCSFCFRSLFRPCQELLGFIHVNSSLFLKN